MLKRIITALLVIVILVPLVGCSDSKRQTDKDLLGEVRGSIGYRGILDYVIDGWGQAELVSHLTARGVIDQKADANSTNSDDIITDARFKSSFSDSLRTPSPMPKSTPTYTPTPEPKNDNDDIYVWIPRTGAKYHSRASCSNMRNPYYVTLTEAIDRGYTKCKKCW